MMVDDLQTSELLTPISHRGAAAHLMSDPQSLWICSLWVLHRGLMCAVVSFVL